MKIRKIVRNWRSTKHLKHFTNHHIDVAYVYISRFLKTTFKVNSNSVLNKVPKISTFLVCKNCKKLKKINENGKSAS